MKKIVTKSTGETFKLGEKFAKKLKGGDVVCMYGELGSGKTTFVKGLVKGLGIDKTITSPTFILMRQHDVLNNSKRIQTLYHLDLYRLENVKDIKGIGFEEILNDKNGVVVIEWAEKAKDLLPDKRIDLNFEYIDENRRRVVIYGKLPLENS